MAVINNPISCLKVQLLKALSLVYLIAVVYLEMCNHLKEDINLLCTICSYILGIIYTWIFEKVSPEILRYVNLKFLI